MRYVAVLRILGILIMIFSLSMLPPIGVYLWYKDGIVSPFIISFAAIFVIGLLLWLPFWNYESDLKPRDGFLIVTLFWTVLATFGAVPLYLSFYPHLSFTDALFESVSGLSTSGATVLSHLDTMPHAILYYRQQLMLLGGVGVVVLALAVLPILGIGGMQLYAAETGGPVKTNKLRPRLRQTAKALWLIYAGLVICCTAAFWLAGMSLFDAIGESFSTIATGGFSPHDQNFAYYHSHLIEAIAVVFMLLGATNFGLHYQFFVEKRLGVYFKDPEFKAYLKIWGTVSLICFAGLLINKFYHHQTGTTITDALFTVTSATTTSGYMVTDYDQWPSFLPYLLMFTALIGGCGGSTSGGIKVLRFLLLKEQGRRELKRLIHPRGIFPVYLGEQPLSDTLIQGIWGFVAIYIVFFIVIILALIAAGLDLRTAFGSAAGALSNTGLGLGKTAETFASINNVSKWILTFAMFAGRLEILTILVLFIPSYWRK